MLLYLEDYEFYVEQLVCGFVITRYKLSTTLSYHYGLRISQ